MDRSPVLNSGILIVGFENNQILKKSYKICQAFASSTIAANIAFNVDKSGQIQFDESFKPVKQNSQELTKQSKERVKYIDQQEDVKDLEKTEGRS